MSATAPASAGPCVASVERVGGRYPFRPVCSCGWSWRGYVAEHAALDMAEAHMDGEL